MFTLYPEIKTYQSHQLAVSELHTLNIEESGNPQGIPVLFMHGGPGGGCDHQSRCFFDPELYRIITFDQRGAGKSTPHAELKDNTTPHLIEDIEKIRHHLNINAWVLFGGSWGSTLSLLYAQAYPEKVLELILRGIFLCRERDLYWFYQEGASRLFPDEWQHYTKLIPANQQNDFISAYYDLLTSENELKRMAAAKAWSGWEGACSTLKPNKAIKDHFTQPHTALAMARIECHYFINKSFIDENQIINNMHKISHIPGVIVHGRYDVVCPLDNAFELKNNWLEARLHIVRDAGHSAFESGNTDTLIRATIETAQRLKTSR
ncbi:MAG: proline iminopeptidase [Oleiphilaceae bacterium]|jgi:proline iminopeptidase